MQLEHTITSNGVERTISENQAAGYVVSGLIYRCDDLSCAREDTLVYHVRPALELENAFEKGEFPFEATSHEITDADSAREFAIEWQNWQATQSLSYGEMAEWQTYFESLIARFPELADEFKENGIV